MSANANADFHGPAGQGFVALFLDCDGPALTGLLERHGLTLAIIPAGRPIPGSFWGDEEAGLVGDRLYARPDTPVHSILHEACHYICMDPGRRAALDTDAGGDHDEENAVCYLQIVLAGELPGMEREKMMRDMDRWGYTFRLGSARAWFDGDAEDARGWLMAEGLLTSKGCPTFRLRQ